MFDVFSFWMMRVIYWFVVMIPAGIAIGLTDALPEAYHAPVAWLIVIFLFYGFYLSHVAAKINVVEEKADLPTDL